MTDLLSRMKKATISNTVWSRRYIQLICDYVPWSIKEIERLQGYEKMITSEVKSTKQFMEAYHACLAENERFKTALEFYANEADYMIDCSEVPPPSILSPPAILKEKGERARRVLINC